MRFGETWVSKASRRSIIIITTKADKVLVRYPNKQSAWRDIEDIKRFYSPL